MSARSPDMKKPRERGLPEAKQLINPELTEREL
jgi:hypothetical protein